MEKVEGGIHGYEKALKRRAFLQAMHPITGRRDIAPPPDRTRDKA
jgi:hypothetical protein